MTFDGQPDRKMSFLRVPLHCQEKNFHDSRSCPSRQISTLASKSYATSDVILGSMRHQIIRASLDFQIILSSSDFLAYLAWQPLLNLNPQNFSSFLSFVIKCIKTLKMQCSLKLEFFFIATSNSGLDSKQQIRDAGCLKKMSFAKLNIWKSCCQLGRNNYYICGKPSHAQFVKT